MNMDNFWYPKDWVISVHRSLQEGFSPLGYVKKRRKDYKHFYIKGVVGTPYSAPSTTLWIKVVNKYLN